MALVNGSNFSVNNTPVPPTCKCTSGSSDGSYAYDDSSVNVSVQSVKFYHNSTLLYTATSGSTGTMYAKTHSYYVDMEAGMSSDGGSYTWTVEGDSADWIADSSGASVISLDDSTSGSGRSDSKYAFKFQDNAGDKLIILVDNSVISETAVSISDGDTFKLEWGAASGSGTFLPPPPAFVRF